MPASPTGRAVSRLSAAASTNATSVKATPGNLSSVVGTNTAAYAVFVKFYNKASAPTVGTDAPLYTLAFPAGVTQVFQLNGARFTTGLSFAITKLAADTDTTVVVAGDLLLTYEWA